jgi:hypothetical protein
MSSHPLGVQLTPDILSYWPLGYLLLGRRQVAKE